QSLAGMAFNNASLGYVHAIAHQFGGFYNFPHGVCNAILLPHVCRFNLIARKERFAEIAALLGENIELLSTYEAAEMGIQAIETLAKHAMKDATALTNPRKPKLEEVIEIIKNAM